MRKSLEVLQLIVLLLSYFVSSTSSINGGTTSSSCMISHGGDTDATMLEYPRNYFLDQTINTTDKNNISSRVRCESYYGATLQGRRKYQEDRILCDLDVRIPIYGEDGLNDVKVGVVAVFDGHGGAEASETASKLLLDYLFINTRHLLHRRQAYSTALEDNVLVEEHKDEGYSLSLTSVLSLVPHEPIISMKNILKEALVRTILDIDTAFSKEALRNNLVSGTTATVVLLVDGQILVANVGDCRALLCSQRFHSQEELQGGLMREFKRRRRITYKDARMVAATGLTRLAAEGLTREHHPDQADERMRVEDAGGDVTEWAGVARVNGQLAVSRSIGDVQYKRFGVIPSPEVTDWTPIAANDSYLVVASDGIYERLTSQDVCDLLPFRHSKGYEMLKIYPSCDYHSAECIVKTAYDEGSTDNLSTVVIPLKNLKHGNGGEEALDGPRNFP